MLKLKLQYFGLLMQRTDSFEKNMMLGKTEGKQEEKGKTEDEMVDGPTQFNGHEFEQFPGDGEGQGSLACCSPWGFKESDTTEQLNNKTLDDLQKTFKKCTGKWYFELFSVKGVVQITYPCITEN